MRKHLLIFLALLLFVGAAQAAKPSYESAEESIAARPAPTNSDEPPDDDAIEAFDESAEEPVEEEPEPAADPAPVDPSLRPVFDQFGGEPGLVALMDDFMARLLADPRMRPFFAQTDHAEIKRHLVEQFCAILGGGCAYTGRDMRTTHAGLGIDRADFNALVEDLQLAMDARHIPFRAQNRLLAKLAPMHREIEEK
jgi:hemoglobin